MTTDLMKFVAAVIMYAAWGVLAFLGKTDVGPFVGFTMAALGAIMGHSSATVSRAVPASVDVKQGGFASIRMLCLIAFVAAFAIGMSGCTTTTASLYRGYATDAKAGIQTWDDNAIATLHDVFCAQPYSAIQRHPEIQPGMIALCGGMANVTSLDPNQVQLMLSIAKQLGYAVPPAQGLQPAPAAMIGK